jgi:hypothetical protein
MRDDPLLFGVWNKVKNVISVAYYGEVEAPVVVNAPLPLVFTLVVFSSRADLGA